MENLHKITWVVERIKYSLGMSGEHKIFKPLEKLKKVKVTLSGKRKQKSVILNNNFVDNDVIRAHAGNTAGKEGYFSQKNEIKLCTRIFLDSLKN